MTLAGLNVVHVWMYSVFSCIKWRVLNEGNLYSVSLCVSFTCCSAFCVVFSLSGHKMIVVNSSPKQLCQSEQCAASQLDLSRSRVTFCLQSVSRFVRGDKNEFLMKTVVRKKLSRDYQMQIFWRKTCMKKWYNVLKVQVNFVCGFKVALWRLDCPFIGLEPNWQLKRLGPEAVFLLFHQING